MADQVEVEDTVEDMVEVEDTVEDTVEVEDMAEDMAEDQVSVVEAQVLVVEVPLAPSSLATGCVAPAESTTSNHGTVARRVRRTGRMGTG